MAINWQKIQGQVDGAIKKLADVGTPGGYPATLRIEPSGTPASPGGPPSGSVSYSTIYCIEGVREIRDLSGATVLQVRRTLTISAAGAVPAKGQSVAVGVEAATAEADPDAPTWHEIVEVRPTAPAGIAVLYEVDLAA